MLLQDTSFSFSASLTKLQDLLPAPVANFAPILVFLGLSYLAYKYLPKKSNIIIPILLASGVLDYLVFVDYSLAFFIAQSVAAVILFFLLVFALGNKTSLGTIFIVTGVIALTPGVPGVIALLSSGVIAFIFGILSMMKTQDRTIQDVGFDIASTSGLLSLSTPAVDSVPDRKEVQSNEKVFSVAPYFFFPYLAVMAVLLFL